MSDLTTSKPLSTTMVSPSSLSASSVSSMTPSSLSGPSVSACPSIRIAVVGNVDASKSTLIGVLSNGVLDDGNGLARRAILTHQHEIKTGRTSSVSVTTVPITNGLTSSSSSVSSSSSSVSSSTSVSSNSLDSTNKGYLSFLDLAGHEQYLRTTLQGLTNYFPHYAILVIEASNNPKTFKRMTLEHFAICRRLQLPVIFVISKIDLVSPEGLTQTVNLVKRLCKEVRIKFIYDIVTAPGKPIPNLAAIHQTISSDPVQFGLIFRVSNKTGQDIPLLRSFLDGLPVNLTPSATALKKLEGLNKFMTAQKIQKYFIITRPYHVNGIGWIVYGFNRGAPIKKSEKLLLGPFRHQYYEVRIRSIHDEFRNEVPTLGSMVFGCLAIRPIDASISFSYKKLSKNKVILDKPVFAQRVRADIVVSGSQSTIKPGYNSYVHCEHIQNTARVIETWKGKDALSQGDRGSVVLRFYNPQFIYPSAELFIREGLVKIIGTVTEILPDDNVLGDFKNLRCIKKALERGEITPDDLSKLGHTITQK